MIVYIAQFAFLYRCEELDRIAEEYDRETGNYFGSFFFGLPWVVVAVALTAKAPETSA